jgi:transcriptional regulator with XRE-family HTH domain
MKLQEGREIALTSKFLRDMVEAREARGWSQSELGRKLGISQPAVSNIENGTASSSRYVLAICELLEIDPPLHLRERVLEEWLTAGGRLLRSNPALFQTTLAMIESAAPNENSPLENSNGSGEDSGKPTK